MLASPTTAVPIDWLSWRILEAGTTSVQVYRWSWIRDWVKWTVRASWEALEETYRENLFFILEETHRVNLFFIRNLWVKPLLSIGLDPPFILCDVIHIWGIIPLFLILFPPPFLLLFSGGECSNVCVYTMICVAYRRPRTTHYSLNCIVFDISLSFWSPFFPAHLWGGANSYQCSFALL